MFFFVRDFIQYMTCLFWDHGSNPLSKPWYTIELILIKLLRHTVYVTKQRKKKMDLFCFLMERESFIISQLSCTWMRCKAEIGYLLASVNFSWPCLLAILYFRLITCPAPFMSTKTPCTVCSPNVCFQYVLHIQVRIICCYNSCCCTQMFIPSSEK